MLYDDDEKNRGKRKGGTKKWYVEEGEKSGYKKDEDNRCTSKKAKYRMGKMK